MFKHQDFVEKSTDTYIKEYDCIYILILHKQFHSIPQLTGFKTVGKDLICIIAFPVWDKYVIMFKTLRGIDILKYMLAIWLP